MTAENTARNAVNVRNTPANADSPNQQAASGWDPYEVWRTRVLIPRLTEQRIAGQAGDTSKPLQLVRSI